MENRHVRTKRIDVATDPGSGLGRYQDSIFPIHKVTERQFVISSHKYYSKRCGSIFMKFIEWVRCGPRSNRLNFVSDPDPGPESGIQNNYF